MPVLLAQDMPGCSGPVLLSCIANGATSIFFQVFEYNGDGFYTLTSVRIRYDSDFDEIQENGVYTLQINHAEKHNGSQFRCTGFSKGARVYSGVVLLLVGKFVWCIT